MCYSYFVTDEITKKCPRCGQDKPVSEYHGNPKSRVKSKTQTYCKPCGRQKQKEWIRDNPEGYRLQKLRQRLRRFNLSVDQFDHMLKAQRGRCAICGTEINTSQAERLSVDHDHKCCPGKTSCGSCVRGLLCTNCNSGLGHFKDNPDLLRAAVEYIS